MSYNSFQKVGAIVIIFGFLLLGCRVKLEPVRILTFQEKLSELFTNPVVLKTKDSVNNYTIYNFKIDQFLDKSNKELGVFKQQFALYHIDENLPVVVKFTNDFDTKIEFELSSLFKANYLVIAHRNILNELDNCFKNDLHFSNDSHFIISQLKRIYTGKWISFGKNLDANNALIHRNYYPWDVEATLVENSNFSILSSEVIDFLENRGKKIIYLESDENLPISIKPHVDAIVVNEIDNELLSNKLKQWLGYSVKFIN